MSCAIVSTIMRTTSAMTSTSAPTTTTTPSSSAAPDAPHLNPLRGAGRRRRRAAARQRRKAKSPDDDREDPSPEIEIQSDASEESVYDDIFDDIDDKRSYEEMSPAEVREAPPHPSPTPPDRESSPTPSLSHLSKEVRRALADGWVPPPGLHLSRGHPEPTHLSAAPAAPDGAILATAQHGP